MSGRVLWTQDIQGQVPAVIVGGREHWCTLGRGMVCLRVRQLQGGKWCGREENGAGWKKELWS